MAQRYIMSLKTKTVSEKRPWLLEDVGDDGHVFYTVRLRVGLQGQAHYYGPFDTVDRAKRFYCLACDKLDELAVELGNFIGTADEKYDAGESYGYRIQDV